MKVILINDYIGIWGCNEQSVSEQLQGLEDGEAIEIKINSPGGSIYIGVAIFNTIRELAKTHDITVRITALCASMATYIALAARTIDPHAKIIVSENALFVIHNPFVYTEGDYRELKREADRLEKLAAMLASTYAFIAKKTEKQIRSLMDDETWYVGKEIMDNGFANTFEEINTPENEPPETLDSIKINAQMAIARAAEKAKAEYKSGDIEKAVALVDSDIKSYSAKPSGGKDTFSFQEGKEHIKAMTLEELKNKFPELYNAVMALGIKEGLEKERERVTAHLDAGKAAGAMEMADKFIREGSSMMSDKVQGEYFTARLKNVQIQDRNADNPPDITSSGSPNDEDLMKIFESGFYGKGTQKWA